MTMRVTLLSSLMLLAFSTNSPASEMDSELSGREWVRSTRFRAETPPEIIDAIYDDIDSAYTTGRVPIVVLDLDETLYTYHERTREGVLQWARHAPEEYSKLAELILTSPILQQQRTLVELEKVLRDECGYTVDPDAIADLTRSFNDYVFLGDKALHLDRPFPNAVMTAQVLYEYGATIVYLTSRFEKEMYEGTKKRLIADGFPWSEDGWTHLVMRNVPRTTTAAVMKTEALFKLMEGIPGGKIIAVIDNEPGTVVKFAETFPHAKSVFMHSASSSRPAKVLHDEIYVLPGFPMFREFPVDEDLHIWLQ